jgi:hypothetical protein
MVSYNQFEKKLQDRHHFNKHLNFKGSPVMFLILLKQKNISHVREKQNNF